MARPGSPQPGPSVTTLRGQLRAEVPVSPLNQSHQFLGKALLDDLCSPTSGSKHGHRLDAGLHAEPHQHDPCGGSGTRQGAPAQPVGRCCLLHCAGHSGRTGGHFPAMFLENQVASSLLARGILPTTPGREVMQKKVEGEEECGH